MAILFRPFFRPCRLALLVLLGAALAGGLTACDTNNDDEGRFEAFVEARGGGPERLDGRALFSTDSGAFTLDLVPRSDRAGARTGLIFARDGGGLPGDGRSYALVVLSEDGLPTDRFAAAVRLNFGGPAPALYYATGGRIDVATASTDRVEGTFRFDATLASSGGNVDAPFELRVEGSFSAEPGPTDRFPR
jgi:hypothetical protein